jgi:hypothetical protein
MEIDIDLSHLRHIRIDLIEGAAPRITLYAGHKSDHIHGRGGYLEEGGSMTIPITRDRMNAILDQFNP